MKPEWKQLVDSVLSGVDITRETQESVISVTNAIVTPLSLLIHAAGLSQEDSERCQTIWQETMKMLGAKCVERESKAIQVRVRNRAKNPIVFRTRIFRDFEP